MGKSKQGAPYLVFMALFPRGALHGLGKASCEGRLAVRSFQGLAPLHRSLLCASGMAKRFPRLSTRVSWQRLPGEIAERDAEATSELNEKVPWLSLSPDRGV